MTRVKPENRKYKVRRQFKSEAERKAAQKERSKQWRLANPEKAKASVDRFNKANPLAAKNRHLLKKYGVSIDDVYTIVDLQGGCAICGAISPGRKGKSGGRGEWIVDHNHVTGKPRGVLCHQCNCALGMAKDDPVLLRRMADYLEKNQ